MNENLKYSSMVLLGIMVIMLHGGVVLAPIIKGISIYLASMGFIAVIVGVYILRTPRNVSRLKEDEEYDDYYEGEGTN